MPTVLMSSKPLEEWKQFSVSETARHCYMTMLTAFVEHCLFKATAFPSWEGLFWEKASGFEGEIH